MGRNRALIGTAWLAFLMLIHTASLAAQDPAATLRGSRLAVVPFVNSTDEEQYDRVAASISEALTLILHWSGQYDLRELEPLNPFAPEGRTTMARRAREQRVRAVLFGRLTGTDRGRLELESVVYGTEEGHIIGGDRREAFGAFDLVEAADELILKTASALLGYDVKIGAVQLRPSRDDVAYRVRIDGKSVGENVRVVPQVLTGQRTIEITITSMGEEIPIYSAVRLIQPGQALELNFQLPAVTRMEQDDILLRHDIASRLLGAPQEHRWAREALAESDRLLQATDAPALDRLRREQTRLETIWTLEKEFADLRPGDLSRERGNYEVGEPLYVLPESRRIRDGIVSGHIPGDRGVEERLRRNAVVLYQLSWLRWGEALAVADWDEADRILSDLARLRDFYNLPADDRWQSISENYEEARAEAQLLARRRRRPWPYLSLGIGLGGIGYGGYLYATDQVGSQSGSDAEVTEYIQWGSIAAGGVISMLSIARIVGNNRAGEAFLREWAREQHGGLMDTAARAFDPQLTGDGSGGSTVLVLGPLGDMITIGSTVDTLPVLRTVPAGRPLRADRATIVSEDANRLLTPGLTLVAVE